MDASWFPAGYRLSSQLADKGALGTFAAVDGKSRKKVVLKALDEESCDPSLKLAFLRSHEQLSGTALPFVPAVGPIEKKGNVLFFESEFVPGLPWGRAVGARRNSRAKLLAFLFSALSDLHSTGEFHGALKPNNVLYDAGEGKLFLLDLGLWGHETASQAGAGELIYSAPELKVTSMADVRSDFYGFGLLALELFTGLQVDNEALAGLLSHDREAAGEWLRTHAKNIRPDVLNLILEATSPRLSQRPQSCLELLELLRPVLGTKMIDSLRTPQKTAFALCTEFTGRDEVLSRLFDLMTEARARGVGAVKLTGVSGSGKSRIADEFVAECRERGHSVVRSFCSDTTLNPYCSVLQWLESAAKLAGASRSKALLAAAGAVHDELLKLLEQPSRGSDVLCGTRAPAMTKTLRRKVLQAVLTLVKQEFWVFVLDDAQSMLGPAVSLLTDLLRQSAERAKNSSRVKGGLFVLLTATHVAQEELASDGADVPGQQHSRVRFDDPVVKRFTETICLAPLKEESAALLVESVVGARAPLRSLSSLLYDCFSGNPAWLATGAKLTCLREGISIPVDNESVERLEALEGPMDIPTPEPLAKAALSGLDEASRKLLEVIALLPGGQTIDLIEAVYDDRNLRVIRRIDGLCREGFLIWRRRPGAIVVDFKHKLFERLCLGNVTEEQTPIIHRRAAEYRTDLSSGAESNVWSRLNLNYHLAKSEGGEQGFRLLEPLWSAFHSAGCYVRALELLNDAIDLFHAATGLSESTRHKSGAELYLSRGDLYVLVSDYTRGLLNYEKSLSFAQRDRSAPDECVCMMRIAEVHRLKGELQKAVEVLSEAKSTAAAHEDAQNEGLAAHAIGKVLWHQGKLDAALRSFKVALQCTELVENEDERGAILHNIGAVFWAQGKYEQAKGRFIQAKRSYERTGEEHMRAVTLNSIGSAHAEQSEMTLAMECYSEALSTFQRLGDRRNASMTLQNIASNLFRQGDLGVSLEKIEEAISIKSIMGDIVGHSAAVSARGEMLREIGDYDGALRSHYEAFQTLMAENEAIVSDTAALQIGLDHLEFGAFASAFFCLEQLLSRKDEIKPSTAVSAMLGLARTHLEVGDRDKTVELCNEVLSLLEGQRKPIDKAMCLITLSRVYARDERLDDAADYLQRASSIVKELNSPFPQFQLFWALGDYHLKANNLTESYTSYAHAASTLETLAATLPGDKQEQFAKKRSLERFRMGWNAIRRELEEDAPEKAEVSDTWVESTASSDRTDPFARLGGTDIELTEACDIIISHLLAATPFERGCIAIRADNGRLRLTRAIDKRGRVLDRKQLGGPASVSRRVNLTGTPVLTRRGAEKPDWLRDLDISGSIMCVPLCGKLERLGTIYLDSSELLEMPSDHPLLAVQSLARLATKVIEDAVLRERQNAYIKELANRARLLAGERGVPSMLVPGTTLASEKASAFPELIGASERLLEVIREAAKIVKTDVTVLITGETGTGKELLADAIHRRSLRKDAPLLVINCGAIPRDLIESELFGFEKGAFTGAHKQKRGRLEYGDKGTIFLDEIAELSLDMQVKLLRFLETKTIERVGGIGQIRIDCRIIAATNCNLEIAVKDGSFREDLYYRVSVIHLELPPIREREDDILRLANHFLSLGKEKYNKRKKLFSVRAVERMMHHRWPGNVRELQNKVEKAILISTGSTITDVDLGLIRREESQIARLKEVKDGVEVSRLKTALRASGGNVAQAARMAGLSRQNFYRLLKKHRLSLDEYRAHESA